MQPAVANRRGVARDPDEPSLQIAVNHLESVKPVQGSNCNCRRDAKRTCEVADVHFGATGRASIDPRQSTSHQGRGRPEELRPHLLDIRVGQSPPIVSTRRDGITFRAAGLS